MTDGERSQMKEMLTKEGYFGLTSADDRTAYVDMRTGVATLTYDLAAKCKLNICKRSK